MIEIRAQAFYPLYEAELRAAGSQVSVAAIMRDEDRHVEEMQNALTTRLPRWQERLEAVLDREGRCSPIFWTRSSGRARNRPGDSARAPRV